MSVTLQQTVFAQPYTIVVLFLGVCYAAAAADETHSTDRLSIPNKIRIIVVYLFHWRKETQMNLNYGFKFIFCPENYQEMNGHNISVR